MGLNNPGINDPPPRVGGTQGAQDPPPPPPRRGTAISRMAELFCLYIDMETRLALALKAASTETTNMLESLNEEMKKLNPKAEGYSQRQTSLSNQVSLTTEQGKPLQSLLSQIGQDQSRATQDIGSLINNMLQLGLQITR